MPLVNKLTKLATKPIPRMLSPAAHAVADYIASGSFLIGVGYFWPRNKRAALAALVCGGAGLVLSLLTDYPGGIKKAIGFRTHRHIDFGLATMSAMMPEFMDFEDDSERKFFLGQGALITAANEVTQFSENQVEGRRAKAA